MFEPSPSPRVLALPPGADFPKYLVKGLLSRVDASDPAALARVELFVNTRRMARRVAELFADGNARFLPRIRLITDLAATPALADLPPALPPLRRRLLLTQLIGRLLEQQPDLAPRGAIFDLAGSLATLLDEMQGEGVPFERLETLDVGQLSGHWQRSLTFLNLVTNFLRADGPEMDREARQRAMIERLIALWQDTPPQHPVIVAGSTGSRGATSLFMRAVAGLPQGALVLPGYDFAMPDHGWQALNDAFTAEDHPQYRFAKLLDQLDMTPGDVAQWCPDTPEPKQRNALVSLALRPAPVTDKWMTEGPALGPITPAAQGMDLIEAPSVRAEALAIALCLREAVAKGQRAALITPDRMLTRQVTAALDRWHIRPDDSAGTPLHLSAPGRFLRHVAELFGQKLSAEGLLTLLKHPLTHSGPAGRGTHLLLTRELELTLRRSGPVFPTPDDLRAWAAGRTDRGIGPWADWLASTLEGLEAMGDADLSTLAARHLQVAEALAVGVPLPDAPTPDSGELWLKDAGEKAALVMANLMAEAGNGGTMTPAEYGNLLYALLSAEEVRRSLDPHPDVMIWGTLEARVQGADLVILGGLNDGVWPALPTPDPWLNRTMRHQAGLLLPERGIGLSAHDFQQAIAAPRVVLSRAIRNAEAETVPSRWLNRLMNLLNGLGDQNGPQELEAMRQRGRRYLDLAAAMEVPATPRAPAPRPSPRPPLAARPRNLSVTSIQTLIRDPYAIYARHVLRLNRLDPLRPEPDPPLRGTVLHDILHEFVDSTKAALPKDPRAHLMAIAHRRMEAKVPWPTTRRIWLARLDRVADWFLEEEATRRAQGTPLVLEEKRTVQLGALDFTLTGKLDRVDQRHDGAVVVYDYKTGKAPTKPVIRHFDKQLMLEAAMIELGAFETAANASVALVCYISLGTDPKTTALPLDPGDALKTWAELAELIGAYHERGRGYTSRRAMGSRADARDYDHLARFGEWDESSDPTPEEVG